MDDPDPLLPSRPPRPVPRKSRLRSGPLGWIFFYTRGLIVDQHLRRLTMFYVVLVDMVMVFVGALFLEGWLQPREHFWRFAFYWLAVAWLTILAALLAVYDILLLRVQHRIVRRELRQKMLGEEQKEHDPDK